MNLKRTAAFARRRSRGLTLIELMIAMVLGILVTGGIITVFISTSKSSRAQEQQARLQEAGRFAIDQLTESLRMTSSNYCSGSGGIATSDGPVYVDGLRAPYILATGLDFPDNTTPFADGVHPVEPAVRYPLPSYFYMRGYDCDASTCTPEDPNTDVSAIPAMGTNVGDRVRGADVLTIRYLDPNQGWVIGNDDILAADTDHFLVSATMTPESEEPALADIPGGDQLVLLTDCNFGVVYSADFDGTTFATNTGTANMERPQVAGTGAVRPGLKLFPFEQAFTTVTWYLQVAGDGSATGNKTGALMRRVNGVTQELVRGVERLDFRFGVEDDLGNTLYLTANQVDTGVSGVSCPKQPSVSGGVVGLEVACLWRAIKTIEVSMLLDGQSALPSLADGVLAYAYTPDGTTPQPPAHSSHTIKFSDQGFSEHMIRREFSALVSVRNYNP